MKYAFFFVLAVATAFSCQEEGLNELPPEEVEFHLEGALDGIPFSFEAGKENYYQYTSTRVEGGTIIYSGSLQPSCDENYCPVGLTIRIYDTVSMADPENILGMSDIPFYYNEHIAQNGRQFVVDLSAMEQSAPPDQYEWLIDNRLGYGHLFTDTVSGSEHFICLSVYEENCASQLCRSVDLLSGLNCGLYLEVSQQTMDEVEVSAASAGSNPFDWVWNNGTVQDSFVVFESGGSQYVCATLNDANDCVAVSCAQIVSENGDLTVCQRDFEIRSKSLDRTGKRSGKVEVIFTDETGRQYSSAWISQVNAAFTISEYGNYRLNAEGDPVIWCRADFNCSLADPDGNVIRLESGRGVTAVAYQ